MEKTIQYVQGDATAPQGPGNKIIAHVCNDIGGWGRGFVLAVSARWPEPEKSYRAWHRRQQWDYPAEWLLYRGPHLAVPFALGQVQVVQVAEAIFVANMVGQHGIRFENGQPPIRYEAIRQALHNLASEAVHLDASVHMPRIGCGLAGGKWPEVERLINEELCEKVKSVTVYDPI